MPIEPSMDRGAVDRVRGESALPIVPSRIFAAVIARRRPCGGDGGVGERRAVDRAVASFRRDRAVGELRVVAAPSASFAVVTAPSASFAAVTARSATSPVGTVPSSSLSVVTASAPSLALATAASASLRVVTAWSARSASVRRRPGGRRREAAVGDLGAGDRVRGDLRGGDRGGGEVGGRERAVGDARARDRGDGGRRGASRRRRLAAAAERARRRRPCRPRSRRTRRPGRPWCRRPSRPRRPRRRRPRPSWQPCWRCARPCRRAWRSGARAARRAARPGPPKAGAALVSATAMMAAIAATVRMEERDTPAVLDASGANLRPVVRRPGRAAVLGRRSQRAFDRVAPPRSTGSPCETSTISTGRSRTGASASRSSATVILVGR